MDAEPLVGKQNVWDAFVADTYAAEPCDDTLQNIPSKLEKRLKKKISELHRENRRLKTELKIHKQTETHNAQLQALLYQSQKMEAIGTLAGGIAHNFNNLLMGIQGNVSLMLLAMEPSHPNFERLQRLEDHIASGEKLTAQILGYARCQSLEAKPMDLNRLVLRTLDIITRIKKEVTVSYQLARDLSSIEADEGQIEQVLLNMFINAVEAMPNGGELIIKTANTTPKELLGKPQLLRSSDYVRLSITDTGTGMDAKTLKNIFKPFFTTKAPGKGTGLGLVSADGIVKNHNGHISVQSEVGRGTTFIIYLPASGKPVALPASQSKAMIKGAGTILLVDDETIILEVSRDLLKSLNYNVLTAQNGQDAVKLYQENMDTISLVLLDMTMPGLNGGDTFDMLKRINPKVKVILTSGYSIKGPAEEILKRGCNGFLKKPFGINELSQIINRTLNRIDKKT